MRHHLAISIGGALLALGVAGLAHARPAADLEPAPRLVEVRSARTLASRGLGRASIRGVAPLAAVVRPADTSDPWSGEIPLVFALPSARLRVDAIDPWSGMAIAVAPRRNAALDASDPWSISF
jgi:hypothetical protein